MSKWIAEFDLEDGDKMPEHMDLTYMGAKIDFHCRSMWIPVSERLPEIDELVLVTDDSGGIKTVDVDRCGQYECSEKRFWYYTQNVVAWMPLPKAYEGKK